MSKILVLGNSNNIWIARFVKYVLYKNFRDIIVGQNSEISKVFLKDYYDCNTQFINTGNLFTLFGKIRIKSEFIRFLRTVFEIIKIKDLDIIHLHYVSRTFLLVLRLFSKSDIRLIATFWGSDLLRHKKSYFNRYKRILHDFDTITVSSEEMRKELIEKIPGLNYEKIRIVKFGISTFKSIDMIEKSKSMIECRSYFGIDREKFVIAVGYNRSRAQHHIDIIKALGIVKEDIKKNLLILFQMTYGTDDKSYYDEINTCLCENGLDSLMLFDYLDENESALLRLSVDYFINAQDTDAFSATMQEYLYAGSHVINSSRLKYKELEEMSGHISMFDDYDDITKFFNETELKHCLVDNHIRESLKSISSWDCSALKWLELYQ